MINAPQTNKEEEWSTRRKLGNNSKDDPNHKKKNRVTDNWS